MRKLSGERDIKAEISEVSKSYLGESEESIPGCGRGERGTEIYEEAKGAGAEKERGRQRPHNEGLVGCAKDLGKMESHGRICTLPSSLDCKLPIT